MSSDPFQNFKKPESDATSKSADDAEHLGDSAADILADVPLDFDLESLDDLSEPTSDAARLKNQLKEAEERVLRAQAEIENVRRRARREIDEERKFANLPLLTDLLPVVDNIDRAIQAAEKTADANSLLQGFQMVSQLLLDTLSKHHCKRIPAKGNPFDPQLHSAILQQPSDEHPNGHVVMVAQEGYQLHDRVIRPTQVIVSTGPKS